MKVLRISSKKIAKVSQREPKGAKREPQGAQSELKGSQREPTVSHLEAQGCHSDQNASKNRSSEKVAKRELKVSDRLHFLVPFWGSFPIKKYHRKFIQQSIAKKHGK